MNLIDQIRSDLKEAQLAKNELAVSTLRMLISELSYAKIRLGHELVDPEVYSVLQKEIKKRQESISAFRAGNRDELAQKEEQEANVLANYLPPQKSLEELTKIIEETINTLGAKTLADMGKVMESVKTQVGSSADPSQISTLVREKLNG